MAANVYQAVKQAMQDLVAPQLESLKGDIGTLRAEMRGEIKALRSEMDGGFKALRAEMQGGFKAVDAEIRRIDDKLTSALDLRERIVAIEARLDAERR